MLRRSSIDRDSAGSVIARTGVNHAMAVPVMLLACLSGGCAVVAVTDAAVTATATMVKVGANVVGGAADVARAGVRAVTNNDGQKK